MEATRRRTEVDGMSAEQMQQAINEAVREPTSTAKEAGAAGAGLLSRCRQADTERFHLDLLPEKHE